MSFPNHPSGSFSCKITELKCKLWTFSFFTSWILAIQIFVIVRLKSREDINSQKHSWPFTFHRKPSGLCWSLCCSVWLLHHGKFSRAGLPDLLLSVIDIIPRKASPWQQFSESLSVFSKAYMWRNSFPLNTNFHSHVGKCKESCDFM